MPPKELEFIIDPADAGCRLDAVLARLAPDSSRSYLQKIIRAGGVSLDGKPELSPRAALKSGAVLRLALPETVSEIPAPEAFEFPILYEDDAMLVIDKPAGVVVHPGAGNPTGTVVNALLGRYPGMADLLAESGNRPGIVHRLDKDTSGCLVVAKTPQSQFKLAAAFAGREVHKTYLALVRGVPRNPVNRVENLIGRHPVNRQKMAVVPRNGKNAISILRLVSSGLWGTTPYSLLEVDILTGRTHQIRVHASSLGHPVLGDETYGGVVPDFPAPRQLLHAWKLELPHPSTGEIMTFYAPVPPDMAALIGALPGGKHYVVQP